MSRPRQTPPGLALDLSDRVAVVTGASQGIGRAIALDLGVRGASVVVTGRSLARAESCAAEIREKGGAALALPVDVREEESVAILADQIGARFESVDILVNNAGIGNTGSVTSSSRSDWNEVLSTNLTGPFLCTKYFAPRMNQLGRGSIINIGSILGVVCMSGAASYSAAKAGLHHLTKQTALDLAPSGIRANCVAPGFIRTEMFETNHPAVRQKRIPDLQALPRVGTAEEVAYAVSFLASDLSSFITGAIILVDGGLTAQFGFSVIDDESGAEPVMG